MAYKLKICANDKLADEWIAKHNVEHYYIGPYENSKNVAIIWDDNANNSFDLEDGIMASKYSKKRTFANDILAKKFVEDAGLTDCYISPWSDKGEIVVMYDETPKSDNVNHPSHYETNGIECIDAMVASQGAECVMNYCLCNAFKYIWRCQHKGKRVEDIQKAVWYLNKWQELAEKEAMNDE